MIGAFECSFIRLGEVCVTWVPIIGAVGVVVVVGFLWIKELVQRGKRK